MFGYEDDYAETLSREILKGRLDEISNEYFAEVSEKAYKRLYGNQHGKPYLNPYKHGGYWFEEPNGEKHYYMLRRKYYSSKKIKRYGKPFVAPNRKQMGEAYHEFKTMSGLSEMKSIVIHKDSKGSRKTVVMSLPYDKRVPQYAHSYIKESITYQGNSGTSQVVNSRKGRMNSVDRLIMKSVERWCGRFAVSCVIEGKGESEDENA